MKRQLICLTGAAAIFAMSALPVGGTPQMVSLMFAIPGPYQVGGDELHRKLDRLAPNRFVIDQRAGATLGSENALLAATRSGAADIAVISGSIVGSLVPELGVLDIPFLFRDTAQAKAAVEGTVGRTLEKHFSDKGLTLLAIGNLGFRNITNSKRPIRSPEDLRGLKIRVPPTEIYQMTFKALGAEVIPMEFTAVYSALKDSRIDGQETPINIIAGSHFEEVQKYLTTTGHFFTPLVFIANREMFEELKPADQTALIAAAKAGAEATWTTAGADDDKSIEQLRKSGMQIVEKFDRQSFLDAVKPLEPEFEKRFGKELLTQIRATP